MKITEKSVAQAELQRRLKQTQREQAGLIDPSAKSAAEPVEPFVATYIGRLENHGRSPDYVRKVQQRLNHFLDSGPMARVGDLSPKLIARVLDDLAGSGLMPSTVNHYWDAMHAFCDWLVRLQGVLAANPVSNVEKAAINGRRRKMRRAMTAGELGRLLNYAPEYRSRFYEFAVLTLLRVSEIGKLRWADMKLEGDDPHIALVAAHTKAKRADTVALDEDYAQRIASWRPPNARDDDPVFLKVPKLDTFKTDCDGAKVDWRPDAQGHSLDRHALRKTGNTLMMTAGVNSEIRQQVARVTDRRLVEETYLDRQQIETREAVRTIGNAVRKARSVGPMVGPTSGSQRRTRSRSGTGATSATSKKTFDMARVGTGWRASSRVKNGGGGGNRTPVRRQSTGTSTCLVCALISSVGESTHRLPSDQPPTVSGRHRAGRLPDPYPAK